MITVAKELASWSSKCVFPVVKDMSYAAQFLHATLATRMSACSSTQRVTRRFVSAAELVEAWRIFAAAAPDRCQEAEAGRASLRRAPWPR